MNHLSRHTARLRSRRYHFGVALTLLVAIVAPSFSYAVNDQPLYITAKNGEKSELALRERIEQVVLKYGLQRWLYTKRIVIDKTAWPPHSHPVLTLGVTNRFLKDDVELAAVLLHEQFHWNVALNNRLPNKQLLHMLKRFLPAIRSAPPFGSTDEVSTYFHVLVCYMEYRALSTALGQATAHLYLSRQPFYTDIYAAVLNEANARDIEAVLAQAGMSY
jgi:hypothetical protein